MYGYIYRIVNRINGKSYIGYTVDFEGRIIVHLNNYKKIKIKKIERSYFYRAIRKYGEENFYVQILEKPIYEKKYFKKILGEREIYYIKLFNTFNNGYNMTPGGDGILEHTEEIRKKISLAGIGRKHSIETKRKMSESMKEFYKTHISWQKGKSSWNKGKHHSKETKQKIKEKRKIQDMSYRKGKTYEEMYGKDKAEEIKKKVCHPFSEEARKRIGYAAANRSLESLKKMSDAKRGKTYEERYGKERSLIIREKMSIAIKKSKSKEIKK